MSFGVKLIYCQPQIDPSILSAERIDIQKIGFLMDFELHQKPLYSAVKYLVRKVTHSQKIRIFFPANSVSVSSYQILMTSIWKSTYFNRSKSLSNNFFEIARFDYSVVPIMLEVHFLTKSLRNASFFKKSKNRCLHVPDGKSDIRDQKTIS